MTERPAPPAAAGERPRLLLLFAVLFGALAGAGGYTFYDAKGLSYLSDDPRACVNCHVMRDVYDGWERGPHHAVAVCNDCHTPASPFRKYLVKASNGWHHSKAFTLQNWHEPIRIRASNARVLQDNCLRCHGGFLEEIAPHGVVPGDDINCIRCHRGVGHGPAR